MSFPPSLAALLLGAVLMACDRAPAPAPVPSPPPLPAASVAPAPAPPASSEVDAGAAVLPEPALAIVRGPASVEVFRLGARHAPDSEPLALGDAKSLGGWPIVARASLPASPGLGALLLAGTTSPEVFRCAPKVIVGVRFVRGADIVDAVLDSCPRLFATYRDAGGTIRVLGTAFRAPALAAAIADLFPGQRDIAAWATSELPK